MRTSNLVEGMELRLLQDADLAAEEGALLGDVHEPPEDVIVALPFRPEASQAIPCGGPYRERCGRYHAGRIESYNQIYFGPGGRGSLASVTRDVSLKERADRGVSAQYPVRDDDLLDLVRALVEPEDSRVPLRFPDRVNGPRGERSVSSTGETFSQGSGGDHVVDPELLQGAP